MNNWWKYVFIPRVITLRDNTARRIAYALPKRVAYWAYIRVGAYATTGDRPLATTHVPDVRMMDALEVWGRHMDSTAGRPRTSPEAAHA